MLVARVEKLDELASLVKNDGQKNRMIRLGELEHVCACVWCELARFEHVWGMVFGDGMIIV